MKFRFILSILSLAILFPAITAQAQDYPSKPITLIVPYPPGGSTDASARVLAERLSKVLNQTIVIENKGGAGGAIGTALLAKAPADGYTILLATLGIVAINPHLAPVQYDVFKDLTAVAGTVTTPTVLVTNKDFPPNTLLELIDYAKAHPNQVFFASSGSGGLTHIIGEQLNMAAGTKITHVPYRGGGPAIADVLGGRVQMIFDSTPVERVKSGQVKALAVMARERLRSLPDVPTVHEAGLPSFPAGNAWLGVLAPAGTPEPIIKRLSDAILEISKQPDYIEKIDSLGLTVGPMDYKTLNAQIRIDYETYGNVIREAGIKIAN